MRETDEELRGRIAEAYGMWGSLMSHALEAQGEALEELASYFDLTREET